MAFIFLAKACFHFTHFILPAPAGALITGFKKLLYRVNDIGYNTPNGKVAELGKVDRFVAVIFRD